MKIKLFVTWEIQYFELGIFSFSSYVYYLGRGFIASTRAFSLLTRAFNLPTRAFNHATRAFSLLTRGFEFATRGFELVTRNSCFTFPQIKDTLNLFDEVQIKSLLLKIILFFKKGTLSLDRSVKTKSKFDLK